jgi:hypothetical protein
MLKMTVPEAFLIFIDDVYNKLVCTGFPYNYTIIIESLQICIYRLSPSII